MAQWIYERLITGVSDYHFIAAISFPGESEEETTMIRIIKILLLNHLSLTERLLAYLLIGGLLLYYLADHKVV